ncbi:MAG: sulfate adenylyltransferase subunit CysN [Acidobacteria bacterium]|nr:sulfate adenylyltransferase subunit CysN [Acidobacteriota bacterium]
MTCGSVDDGKSSLIGRLLYDSQRIYVDQLAAVQRDSARWGTRGDEVDLALLVDGLQAEREQGITIDVAYRYFSTDRRAFIMADTPGHEQYTRNMVTGASTADAAILLVDATRGVQVQTRRHACIVSLLGIRHVIVAVNKMDLVGYDAQVFARIQTACELFIRGLGVPDVQVVPVSALLGDNVVAPSPAMSWYTGAPLLTRLETLDVSRDTVLQDLRFPVQYVNRPSAAFRGYAGTIEAGRVRTGDEVMALPSRRMSRVKTIITPGGARTEAGAGAAVTLTLDDEIDISRGDVLVHCDRAPSLVDRFDAHVIWMADAPLLLGTPYELKIGTRSVVATVEAIHGRIDISDLSAHPAETLGLNEIAMCRVVLAEPVAVDTYDTCRAMGAFILIDRLQCTTVGAGMIRRQASHGVASVGEHLVWQPTGITREQRANQKSQAPCVLWFTGLSGSGKSTIANALEAALFVRGHHSYLLDGDNVRHGLNRDLDFTEAGRVENIRRIGEVAKLFVDAGMIAIAAFISPFRSDRRMVRDLVGDAEFVEIYMSAPLDVCETRDPKGLYAKARSGVVKHFTGVSSPYEAPERPELTIDTSTTTVQESVDRIVRYLEVTGRLKR